MSFQTWIKRKNVEYKLSVVRNINIYFTDNYKHSDKNIL